MSAAADLWRRYGARASFAWDHSHNRLAASARTLLDTRVRELVGVVSRPDGPGPSLGYAGVPDGVVKILQMLDRQRERMGVGTVDHRSGTTTAARLFDARRLPAADLVAVAGTPSQLAMLPVGAALVLPYRLHAIVETADGSWRERVSSRERQWCRSEIRRGDLRLEVGSKETDFDFFYDRMHRPTMASRHGDRARSETRRRAREGLFRRGVLVFVTDGKRRLAGALANRSKDGGTLTPRLGGVLDGAEDLHAAGLLRLLSYLILDWAEGTGIREVDFSGLEAWFGNGLYGYKRRLAPRVVPPADHRGNLALWWHARRDTPEVRDFLVRNPVLEQAGAGELRAVYFHDARRPARLDIPYACRNVSARRLIDLDDFLAAVPRTGESGCG